MKVIDSKARSLTSMGLVVLAVLLLTSVTINAQTDSKPSPSPRVRPDGMSADKSSPSDDRAPLTTFEEEMRAKRAIKLAEKDHQQNLERAKEIEDLGRQLSVALKHKTALDRDVVRKIERLEKLTKKIRGEAGGEDEELNIVDRPTDIPSAAAKIAEASEKLAKNVQNTPRQVVSASVIGNANVLLELIKILRSFYRVR